MKKLMIMLIVVSALAATSFKKDNNVSSSKADKSVMLTRDGDTSIDKGNVSTWD